MSINSDDRPWPQAIAHDDLDWPAGGQRVLVPFHEGVHESEAGVLAGAVAFGADGELYILYAVDDEDVQSPDAIRDRSELKREVGEAFDVPITDVVEAHDDGVLPSFVRSHDVTTTVVDEAETGFFAGSGNAVAGDCHTVVGTGLDSYESPASILVPVAKGPHSGLAVKVAEAIAAATDSWLELFHVVPEDAGESEQSDAADLLDAYEYRVDDGVEVDHLIETAADPADAIIEHADYHSLTILGAPQKGKLRRFLFGSTTDEVRANVAHGPVLTVHRNGVDSTLSRWV